MSDDKQILLALYEQFTREAFTGIIPHHKNLVIDASPIVTGKQIGRAHV